MGGCKFSGVCRLMSAAVVGAVMLAGIFQARAAVPVILNGDAANLERGFKTPPPSAKPFVFWFWLGESVTNEGITADLEAMARFGIGGYIIFHTSGSSRDDLPSIPMLSPEWFDLFKHARKESEHLGLDAGINNCPGYVTDGGPWVTPEFGMQEVVWSETMATGGKPVTLALPRPAIRFSGGQWYNYSDIAVLAVPLPADTQDFRALVRSVTCSESPQPAHLDYSVYKWTNVKVKFSAGERRSDGAGRRAAR